MRKTKILGTLGKLRDRGDARPLLVVIGQNYTLLILESPPPLPCARGDVWVYHCDVSYTWDTSSTGAMDVAKNDFPAALYVAISNAHPLNFLKIARQHSIIEPKHTIVYAFKVMRGRYEIYALGSMPTISTIIAGSPPPCHHALVTMHQICALA